MISVDERKFTIIDTAGLRHTQAVVEAEGIRRTQEEVRFADLVLFIVDPSQDIDSQSSAAREIDRRDTDMYVRVVIVINKADLVPPDSIDFIKAEFSKFQTVVTSTLQGTGISTLEEIISGRMKDPQRKSGGE